MDKIPAALQHKIDYINALDIPDKSKVNRITIATLDYQSYCRARSDSDKNMPYFKGTFLESLATFLDKHDEECAKKWEKFEDKGLQPAKNPPPMPPVMPPKRVINQDITLTNKGNVMGGGGGSGFCSEGGKGGSGFKASKADVDAQRIKDNDESMRRFYAMWSPL
jgi:hypothetical protein